MKKVNMTGHDINCHSTGEMFPGDKSKTIRVKDVFGPFDADNICNVSFGAVEGLPEPVEGTLYIVSLFALGACKAVGRTDCIAPATGHPECKKNDKGHVVSVPGFIR